MTASPSLADPPTTDLAVLLRYVCACWPDARVLALTSTATGTPALAATDPSGYGHLESIRYDAGSPTSAPRVTVRDEAEALSGVRAGGPRFDVVMADPHHEYLSSLRALDAVLAAARPQSVVLVHDCWPDEQLRGPRFVDGAWCGMTFAAFLDVALAGDREWLVVDADFGIGVLGPVGSRGAVDTWDDAAVLSAWQRAADDEDRMALAHELGPTAWHVLPPGSAVPVIDALVDHGADLARRRYATVARSAWHAAAAATQHRTRAEIAENRAAAFAEQAAAAADREQRLAAALAQAEGELAAEQVRSAEQRERYRLLQQHADALERRCATLRSSPSMRVGRAVTSPVRAARARWQRPSSDG